MTSSITISSIVTNILDTFSVTSVTVVWPGNDLESTTVVFDHVLSLATILTPSSSCVTRPWTVDSGMDGNYQLHTVYADSIWLLPSKIQFNITIERIRPLYLPIGLLGTAKLDSEFYSHDSIHMLPKLDELHPEMNDDCVQYQHSRHYK